MTPGESQLLDRAAWTAGVFLAVVIALVSIGGGFWVTANYLTCKAAGEEYGVVTIYRPWSGCEALILGVKVRVG